VTWNRCLTLEELGVADERAAAHLRDCPRCRARWASYREFLEPADTPDLSELREANTALDALIDREFGRSSPATSEAPAVPELGPLSRPPRSVPARRPRWWLWGLVPALGAACALMVLLSPDRGGSGVMRGGKPSPIVVEPVETRADGSVLLRWRRVPGADRYRVRLFDPDLRPLDEGPVRVDTFLVVPAGSGAALCRVAAYAGTMPIAESEARWVGKR